MVDVKVEGDKAIFEVKGWDKLWAFRSSLEIPLSHIRNVYPDPDIEIGWLDSLKLMGTSFPTIFRAGSFYQKGDMVFWDVRNAANTVVVDLEHEHFNKLVIEVEYPGDTTAMLKSAIQSHKFS
jgi:hypothetical protein